MKLLTQTQKNSAALLLTTTGMLVKMLLDQAQSMLNHTIQSTAAMLTEQPATAVNQEQHGMPPHTHVSHLAHVKDVVTSTAVMN